jgi:hypothetical protein
MKKLFAIGLASCLPCGLGAEDPAESGAGFGTVSVIVIEDPVALGTDLPCTSNPGSEATECMAFHPAILTARIQKVSAIHERGRWL